MTGHVQRRESVLAAAVAELADAIESLSGPVYQRPAREHVARAKLLLQQFADPSSFDGNRESDDVAIAA